MNEPKKLEEKVKKPAMANSGSSSLDKKVISPNTIKTSIPLKPTTISNIHMPKPSNTPLSKPNQTNNLNLTNIAIQKGKKEKNKDRRWLIILLLLLLIALIAGAIILITKLTRTPPEHLYNEVGITISDFEMQRKDITFENVNPGDEFTLSTKLINEYDAVYIRLSLIMKGETPEGDYLTVTEVTFSDLYTIDDDNTKTYLLRGETEQIDSTHQITYYYGWLDKAYLNPMNQEKINYEVDVYGDFELNGEYFGNEWQGATLDIQFIVDAIECRIKNVDPSSPEDYKYVFEAFEAQNY